MFFVVFVTGHCEIKPQYSSWLGFDLVALRFILPVNLSSRNDTAQGSVAGV